MAWGKAGSDTLTASGDLMTITNLTASKFNVFLSHAIASGQTEPVTTFNNDTSTNYAYRYTTDGSGNFTGSSTSLFLYTGSNTKDNLSLMYTFNIAGEEKLCIYWAVGANTAGAGTAPSRREFVGKWANTSAQITEIDQRNNGTGDYLTDSNLTALGSDITPAPAIPAPDNVQDNSIFVEKDTGKRYWFDVESANESAFYSASDSTVTYTDGEDVSSKATNIISMAVSPDGTHFYVGEEAGGIHQYDLGTAWDISTAVWQREYTHGVVNPKGLFFSTDGTKMYLGIFNTSDVKRYPLTTAWDVSTVQSTDQSYSTGSIQDLWFSSDGTKMFWSDNSGNVKKLVLGTAWTINSNTSGSQTVNPSDITGIGALQFKPDGTRMFLGGWDSSGRIKQYALATAFDLSTVSFTQEYNASAQTSDMQGMALSATGDKFFVLDQTNDYIRQYDADTIIPATWTWSNDKTRGVFGGGTTTVDVNTMDYIIISTLGNATDFGDLTVARRAVDGVSSDVRGVFGGGENGSRLNVMDYITIATAGNATDFGNLTVARRNVGGVSSDAGRGVFGGGYGSTYENTMDYITIATLGNAIDFGNLTVARTSPSGCNSDVRGVISGGNGSNVMDYITIATLGNATDFGDLSTASGGTASVNSDVRGVIQNGGDNNIIDYITIATTGNTTDFGDSLQVSYGQSAGVSGTTRGVFGGGYNTSNVSQNYIEYVTIATLGNAIDFGDLSQARAVLAGVES